jgi:hypothetical protein
MQGTVPLTLDLVLFGQTWPEIIDILIGTLARLLFLKDHFLILQLLEIDALVQLQTLLI